MPDCRPPLPGHRVVRSPQSRCVTLVPASYAPRWRGRKLRKISVPQLATQQGCSRALIRQALWIAAGPTVPGGVLGILGARANNPC